MQVTKSRASILFMPNLISLEAFFFPFHTHKTSLDKLEKIWKKKIVCYKYSNKAIFLFYSKIRMSWNKKCLKSCWNPSKKKCSFHILASWIQRCGRETKKNTCLHWIKKWCIQKCSPHLKNNFAYCPAYEKKWNKPRRSTTRSEKEKK